MRNTAVVGAGIAGLVAAYYLAKKGHYVTVYDQERYPAMRCSYANGGQVSVSNSEVWTTWANVFKSAKWLLKKDAPLLIRPSLDWDKAVWLAKFLYHTASNDYARNTVRTIQMGIEAMQLYYQLVDEEGIEFDRSDCGILHFYKNPKYWAAAREVQTLYESNGCEWEPVSPQRVVDIEPRLDRVEGILGGVWTASDWTGDIHKFCNGLARVLSKKYNVGFHYNRHVEEISDLLHFDNVVVANGVGAARLSKQIGDNLPVYPVKGYSITIEGNHNTILPRVSLLDDEAKIVTSTLGDRLRVAGTAELVGENYDITRSRIEPLLSWVNNNLPNVSTENYSSWACLRPMTPNMMPIVQQSKVNSKVYYHTGHGHLGWTLSPSTAKQLAEIIK